MLRGEANKIESEMHQTRVEIEHQEKEIGRLRGQLRRMGSKDSLYVSSIRFFMKQTGYFQHMYTAIVSTNYRK